MQSQEHTTVYRKDYRPYSHSIDSVELDFVLNPESTTVTSTMVVTPLRGAATRDLVLDGSPRNGSHQCFRNVSSSISSKSYEFI